MKERTLSNGEKASNSCGGEHLPKVEGMMVGGSRSHLSADTRKVAQEEVQEASLALSCLCGVTLPLPGHSGKP